MSMAGLCTKLNRFSHPGMWPCLAAFLAGFIIAGAGWPQSFIVAASNSSEEAKARANLICDGVSDQVDLLASIQKAPSIQTRVANLNGTISSHSCLGKHSVEWLPGDYHLSATLVIPDCADMVIQAEGSHLHYELASGDAVVLRGMHRCRYRFGTIESHSIGAALSTAPLAGGSMPLALMSEVSYTGLIGKDRRGKGLSIGPRTCTNRFEGTDIHSFDTGIYVADAPGTKIDTNWYWVSYIRSCNTAIQESGVGVDSSVWHVNVDANLDGGVGIRTAAEYGSWYIIMGTWGHEGVNKAVILDPGAEHNVLEIHPPPETHHWVVEDNSGNNTNVILTSGRPPYRQLESSVMNSNVYNGK